MSSGSARLLVVLVLGTLVGVAAFLLWAPTPQAVADAMAAPVMTPTTAVPVSPPPPGATTTTSRAAVSSPPVDLPAPPERGWLVIHGVGDVALDPDYIPNFRTHGYGYAWVGLEGLFAADDLTIANFECVPSNLGAPLEKAYTFRCDPESLPAAAAAGVEVANLANNHGGDFGLDALVDGIDNLRESGIAPVGVGRDLAEAVTPAFFEISGWKVAVLGFGGVIPARSWLATDEHPGMASGKDRELMVDAVRRASRSADLVIVTIHWGRELDITPRSDDVANARAMIEAGADIVIGHHQHRLNPLLIEDGRPVAYGMGNFVWQRITTESATTAVARFVVSPEGEISACLIPAFIESSGQPVLTGPATCDVPVPVDPSIIDAAG